MNIFITGGTSGFGKAIAYRFAERGWNIVITGRREDRLRLIESELRSNYNVKVLALQFDVTQQSQVDNAVNSLPYDFKSIDVLVNNAGLASGLSLIHDGDISDWEKMIDTNIKGLLYVSRAIMPLMINAKKGHIINISSTAGKDVYLRGNVYCARDRKSTRLNSSHVSESRMPSSA